ncbi:MAG: tetratricopeptide repeat protein [Mediterranea sp.]|jgi:signal transduction histidine kinase|nr:tetratricopeptide repeat protein [Mediterranea sp.]
MRLFFPVLLGLSLAGAYPASAQSPDRRECDIDSLENVLRVHPPEGARLLRIHHDLSWCYLYADDYGNMIRHSREGIALAEAMDSLYVAADLYNNLGVAYDYASKPDSAMRCFDKALAIIASIARGSEEPPVRAERIKAFVYGSIANLHSIQGKTNDALEYYFKALALFERHGETYEVANVLGNIGITYYDIENYKQAETYLARKERICRENGYATNLAHALTALSPIYEQKREYAKAISAAEEALAILERHDTNPADAMVCHICLSAAYLKGHGDDAKAMEYATLALAEARALDIPLEVSHVLMQQAEILLFRKQYAEAERLALEALATDSTHLSAKQNLYEYVAKANIGLGNREKALDYFDRFKRLQASYANDNFQKQLSEMEVKYETEKKEIRIADLERERRLTTWLAIVAGGLLLMALATLFFLWRWTVQKRRLSEQKVRQLEQERRLVATQALLDGEVQERARLARDLHDGLGGMLTGVGFNLEALRNSASLGADEASFLRKARQILDESIVEMRRVAHHLAPESLSRSGLKAALGDFCAALPNVGFSWYGDEERLEPKLEAMVYRTAHELVNNALKHAAADSIALSVMRDDDYIAFTVFDDGRGFDPQSTTSGMGLRNIRTRVDSFGGVLRLESTPGGGTEVNVELKISKPQPETPTHEPNR